MALSVVQRTNTGTTSGTSIVLTLSAPTSGNLAVIGFQFQKVGGGITIVSVNDDQGNNWVATPSSPIAGTGGANLEAIYYAKNIIGTAGTLTITVTLSDSSTYSSGCAREISGADLSAPFVDDDAATSTSDTITTGTITVIGSSIIIAQYETDSFSGAPTPFTGYTQHLQDGAGFLFDSYHITSSNEAAGATSATSAGWIIIAASFKEASAVGRRFVLIPS